MKKCTEGLFAGFHLFESNICTVSVWTDFHIGPYRKYWSNWIAKWTEPTFPILLCLIFIIKLSIWYFTISYCLNSMALLDCYQTCTLFLNSSVDLRFKDTFKIKCFINSVLILSKWLDSEGVAQLTRCGVSRHSN